MKTIKMTIASLMIVTLTLGVSSCKKDKMEEEVPQLKTNSFSYAFNNGQEVPTASYDGMHKDDLNAVMMIDELANGKAKITVTLNNTINGETYHMHAHDAADPTTTPSGTPYNETPNSGVFAKMITGNGGSTSVSQETTIDYSVLVGSYDGFFVVHDPLQAISTIDISTYVIVGSFAKNQGTSTLASASFDYAFNTGQVNPSYAYSGAHANTLTGKINVQELVNGNSRVTVSLNSSINGETYMIHAHDAADPTSTPNGTPYNEAPNSNLCVLSVSGNGGMVVTNQISSLSFTNITTTYDGFFVVHDPLQAMSTIDPTTYVLLGDFAR